MFNYLQTHALDNVWCSPYQDRQFIFEPARLTPNGGARNYYKVLWRNVTLPLQAVNFHVYQIGNIHPMLLGLVNRQNEWISFLDTSVDERMVAMAYNNAGIVQPAAQSWYRVTEDRNLIVAVRILSRFVINYDEPLFVRFYSNARIGAYGDETNVYIRASTTRVESTQQILDIQNTFNSWNSASSGAAYAFINGVFAERVSLLNVAVGDWVDLRYDSTISKILRFDIADLNTFQSTLDEKLKYLLHYPGNGDWLVNYQDDIEVFVADKTASGARGVYYHRNAVDAVRQVTHKDYSVVTAYVQGYRSSLSQWNSGTPLQLILYVRQGGMTRYQQFETNRVKELYKLPDLDVLRAMLGIDSTVENWKARTLEDSAYCEIMRVDSKDITIDLVHQAYGYNASSVILGQTPVLVRNSDDGRVVDVPVGLQSLSTAYEYDAQGHLLEWHTHTSGAVYVVQNDDTELVEMIFGLASKRPTDFMAQSTSTLSSEFINARYYTSPMAGGLPTGVWTDVTETGLYNRVGAKVTWFTPANVYTMVRTNLTHLCYSFETMMTNGVIRFSITQEQVRNGQVGTRVMEVPMGELDVFLNGKSLVRGVDYVLNFPEVVINNLKFIDDPLNKAQQVTVRFTGFCNKDFELTQCEEHGWIEYGMLSYNTRYDIRDDKVLRIVVGGAVYDRSELRWEEDDPSVYPLDAKNGEPYAIRDIIVPMDEYYDTNPTGLVKDITYPMREQSIAIDKVVSDYMSGKMPRPDPQGPSVLPERWVLVSPFICTLIFKLIDQTLNDPRIWTNPDEQVIRQICAPYESLLAFDPSQLANAVDPAYVLIVPHSAPTVLELDAFQYSFVSQAIAIYTPAVASLSHSVSIKF